MQIVRTLFLILFLCLSAIHFILKDRFYSLSLVYYACPLPLIIVFGLLVTMLFFRRKRILYLLLVLLLGMNGYFFAHYFGTAANPIVNKPISSILFWNIADNESLLNEILIKKIQQFNPEIIALVEAQISETDLSILKKACPTYQFKSLDGTMLVAVKGAIDDIEFIEEDNVYKFNFIKATIGGKTLSFMIADVNAVPFFNKKYPLEFILDFSRQHQIDILMGDFNTPYESVFFDEFKTDYNSFHPYSIGMTSTWPTPIPVIEIDQIWMGKSFHLIKMEKFYYEVSDHKLLIADYQ